jgi:hypothetical protein
MKTLRLVTACLFYSVIFAHTFVPDDNFEQALIDVGLDTPMAIDMLRCALVFCVALAIYFSFSTSSMAFCL